MISYNYIHGIIDERSIIEQVNYYIERSFPNKDINYKALDIHSNEAKEYIKNDKYLSNLKEKLKKYNGEIIVNKDNGEIIGRFLIGTGKDEGYIGALRVYDKYKGHGFGNILIEDAIKKYKGIDLNVEKDNKVAFNMYKKHGFVIVKKMKDNTYYMKLKSKLRKDDEVFTESGEVGYIYCNKVCRK